MVAYRRERGTRSNLLVRADRCGHTSCPPAYRPPLFPFTPASADTTRSPDRTGRAPSRGPNAHAFDSVDMKSGHGRAQGTSPTPGDRPFTRVIPSGDGCR